MGFFLLTKVILSYINIISSGKIMQISFEIDDTSDGAKIIQDMVSTYQEMGLDPEKLFEILFMAGANVVFDKNRGYEILRAKDLETDKPEVLTYRFQDAEDTFEQLYMPTKVD
jgi:hypothetical protein